MTDRTNQTDPPPDARAADPGPRPAAGRHRPRRRHRRGVSSRAPGRYTPTQALDARLTGAGHSDEAIAAGVACVVSAASARGRDRHRAPAGVGDVPVHRCGVVGLILAYVRLGAPRGFGTDLRGESGAAQLRSGSRVARARAGHDRRDRAAVVGVLHPHPRGRRLGVLRLLRPRRRAVVYCRPAGLCLGGPVASRAGRDARPAPVHAAADGPDGLRRAASARTPTARSTTRPTSSRATWSPMDGAVYLRRICRRGHGEVVSLYEEDVTALGGPPAVADPDPRDHPRPPGNIRPIPMGYLDGLGDLQTQHSLHPPARRHRDLQPRVPDLLRRQRRRASAGTPGCRTSCATLDAAIAREGGKIDALMLSGGEPTVHPAILELIQAATERNVTRVDPQHERHPHRARRRVPRRARKLRDRVEVYLQFDGFRSRRTSATAARTCATIKDDGDPPADRRADLHDARRGGRQGRQRGRGRARSSTTPSPPTTSPASPSSRCSRPGRANPIDPMDRATTTGTIAPPRRADRRPRRPPTTSSRCRAATPTARR